MIVDLEDKEVSGSFELKGGGKVHLRLRSEADERAILAACSKKRAEYPLLKDPTDPAGKREIYHRFEVEDVDRELFFEMTMDRNITGWEGLFDRNKKPIPVTKDNKILLMKNVPAFRDAVNEGLKTLKEQEKAAGEESAKNL
jgi:hypothetical protein